MVAPELRKASRAACSLQQCATTLKREGAILTANITIDVCHREYGPLSVWLRCFEQSIPGPTLSLEAGAAVTLPATLRLNLRNTLDSSEYSTTVADEMIAKDDFGKVETFLSLAYVPFDFVPLAYIRVHNEVMQVCSPPSPPHTLQIVDINKRHHGNTHTHAHTHTHTHTHTQTHTHADSGHQLNKRSHREARDAAGRNSQK